MKKFAKISALLAALVLALAFTGCSDSSDDDDDETTTVVTFTGTDEEGASYTLNVASDYSFKAYSSEYDDAVATGNFSGNPSVDGTYTVSNLKVFDGESMASEEDTDVTISGGSFTMMDITFTKKS